MEGSYTFSMRQRFEMALQLGLAIFIVIMATVCWSVEARADDPGYITSIQFENDFFGGGTDRHFSHGTRIECLTPAMQVITDAADTLPWFTTERARSGDTNELQARVSFSLGQNIYTPEDTASRQLIEEDRPYAGWLYLGFGLVANQGSKR